MDQEKGIAGQGRGIKDGDIERLRFRNLDQGLWNSVDGLLTIEEIYLSRFPLYYLVFVWK